MYEFRFGILQDLDYPLAVIRDIDQRFEHTYILGTTGSGKTSLMLRMALYDIQQGCACIFIDPKGDHTKALYNLVPDKSKVTYFSFENPSLTINPLRKKGYKLNDIIDEFAEILDVVIKQTSPTNPPASENMKEVLWQAINNMDEDKRDIDNLADFLRYPYSGGQYCRRGLSRYWQEAIKGQGGRASEEAATAKRIAIRLQKFANDERFLKIVKGENQLDIADIASKGKILLVDTSRLPMDKRIYLTALFSFAVKSYCEFQKQKEYKPLMFYLDECWMGINDTFEYLLSFSRSFKVGMTLAHQGVHQFPDYRTVKKITSVCNTKIGCFPAGNDEARLLSESFGLEQSNFRELGKYEAWVRIGNQNSPVKMFPPPVPEENLAPVTIVEDAQEATQGEAASAKVSFLKEGSFSY